MIRIGLVGAADPRHRWFLAAAQRRRAGVRVVDVSEPDPELRREVALPYDLPGRSDHRLLLAASEPSLVAVAQSEDPGPVVIDALSHGADVVVAPPVCDTLDELETIAALAAETGHRVTAAHTYRGHPAGRVVKELVDDGRLGRVEEVALLLAGEDEPQLRRAAAEGLDLFLWLTGATAGEISAVTDGHPARVDDPDEFRAAYGELAIVATAHAPTGGSEVIFEVRTRPRAEGIPEVVVQVAGTTGAVEWDVRTGLLRSAVAGADPRTVSCGPFDQPAEWVLDNLLRRSRPAISTQHSLATTRMLLLTEKSRRREGKPQTWQL